MFHLSWPINQIKKSIINVRRNNTKKKISKSDETCYREPTGVNYDL